MRDDALPARRLGLVVACLWASVVISIMVAWLITRSHGMPPGGVPVAHPSAPPADQPALETAPQPVRAARQLEQDEALGRYGAAEDGGSVRVPIEVAMERLAAGARPASAATMTSRVSSTPAASPTPAASVAEGGS